MLLEYRSPRERWWQFDGGSIALICINSATGILFWVALQMSKAGWPWVVLWFTLGVACVVFGVMLGIVGMYYAISFLRDDDWYPVRSALLFTSTIIAWLPVILVSVGAIRH